MRASVIWSVSILFLAGCIFTLEDKPSADKTVKIFYPYPDVDENGQFSGVTGTMRVLADEMVEEEGKVVRYIISQQKMGYWNDDLEFQWNLAMVKSYFAFQEELHPLPGKLNQKKLFDHISSIDPFTNYYDSSQAGGLRQALFTSSSPGAIGIRISSEYGDTLRIRQVAPGSPAEDAGLVKGMQILSINDSSVTGDSAILRFQAFSKGDSGTALKIRVMKNGSEITVQIVKREVDFPTVLLDTLDQYPLLQVFSFISDTYDGKSTSVEFSEALAQAGKFNVILLDLRDNPGGSVSEVLEICDEMISEGIIIREHERYPDNRGVPRFHNTDISARPGGQGEGRRYILLGNGNSASASEIMISAMMEAENAPLVGDTTYGKGVGQVVISETPGKGLLKVTSIVFKSRTNKYYHKTGIVPTHPVEGGPETLEKALDVAREMDGRPLAKGSERNYLRRQILTAEASRQERVRIQSAD